MIYLISASDGIELAASGLQCVAQPIQRRKYFWDKSTEHFSDEDVQCFNSITELSSENHAAKISNMISCIAKVNCKS